MADSLYTGHPEIKDCDVTDLQFIMKEQTTFIADSFNHFHLLKIRFCCGQALSCKSPGVSDYRYPYLISGHSTLFDLQN